MFNFVSFAIGSFWTGIGVGSAAAGMSILQSIARGHTLGETAYNASIAFATGFGIVIGMSAITAALVFGGIAPAAAGTATTLMAAPTLFGLSAANIHWAFTEGDEIDQTFAVLDVVLMVYGGAKLRSNAVNNKVRTSKITRNPDLDIDTLQGFKFKDSNGVEWDFGMVGKKVGDKLVIEEAHIGPHGIPASEVDNLTGKLPLDEIMLDLADHFKVKQIDFPNKMKKTAMETRYQNQGKLKKNFSFGKVTVKIEGTNDVNLSRYREGS